MPWNLGKTSRENLATCDERLRRIVMDLQRASPLDFTILEGHRSVERQQALFRQGATKIDGVTQLSNHNHSPSRAVDISPWPIDWQDHRRFYVLAGAFLALARERAIAIRWGGDWDGDGTFSDQSFHDLPHFELANEQR